MSCSDALTASGTAVQRHGGVERLSGGTNWAQFLSVAEDARDSRCFDRARETIQGHHHGD